MSRSKDRGLPGNGGQPAPGPHGQADGVALGADSFAVEVSIARKYGQKTVTALGEMVRLCEIGSRIADRGRDWFSGDPENVPGLAAEGLIIKMGENVSRVSNQFEADHPEVPWQVIKDMRNRLTHYYESTDYEIVWTTIEDDFPTISAMIRRLPGNTAD